MCLSITRRYSFKIHLAKFQQEHIGGRVIKFVVMDVHHIQLRRYSSAHALPVRFYELCNLVSK